ncbi:MAG: hypothetical protein GY856_30320 [bacterium]|nr:hypothetical protein [bacterium]
MPGGRELPGDVTVRLPKAAKTGTEHQPAAVPARRPAARPLREAVSPPPAWDQAMLRPESPEQVPRTFAVVEPADEARPTTAPRRPMLGVIAAVVVALVALVALWIWWPQPSPVVEDGGEVAAEAERPAVPSADTLAEELNRALENGDVNSLRVASNRLSPREVSELGSSPKAAEALRRAEGILDLYDRLWRADRNQKHAEVIRLADELMELYPAFSEPAEYRQRALAALAGEGESEQAPAQEAEGLPEQALAEETDGGAEELVAAAEAAPEEPVREPERAPREELAGPASEQSAALAQDADAAPRGDPRMDRVLADVARAEAGRRPAEGLMILSSVKPTAEYEERFRATRRRLEKLRADLDRGPPEVKVGKGHPLEYAPNQLGQIKLEIKDDYGIEEAKIWLRVEGATVYRDFPLKPNSGLQIVDIPVSVHQNKTVEFYVRAADPSGHIGTLGSAQAPLKFKKKT